MNLKNDVIYEAKYGFYFLYIFVSAVYIFILYLFPDKYKDIVTSITLLSDPCALGFFFIGGIWLLEENEGLHRFWSISPLKPLEYILSKAFSLSILSVLSSLFIVLISYHSFKVNYILLTFSIFIGSLTFTSFGLIAASYAKSINHYILLSVPIQPLMISPGILLAFSFNNPIQRALPGAALWYLIDCSLKGVLTINLAYNLLILIFWLIIAISLAYIRIPRAMENEGDKL